MEKNGKDAVLRLKKVILQEKTRAQTNFMGVLKSDLSELLSQYLDLAVPPEVRIDVLDNGLYFLQVQAAAHRVKNVKSVD